MTQNDSPVILEGTEDDAVAVKVAEVLAPRLLLALETAPTLPELLGIWEDFNAGVRYVARKRCKVLQAAIQCITEEVNP